MGEGTAKVVDYFWVQMCSVAWRSAFYFGKQMISPWPGTARLGGSIPIRGRGGAMRDGLQPSGGQ